MKAMVFAAGLGTRLKPLTNDRPKALVEVAGRTMLEITLQRLRAFGVNEVIVNTHHLADMIRDYLDARNNFGMRIEISREDVLLDTGGGLKKAAWFFLEDDRDEPFLVHNVDVMSNIDLARMAGSHRRQGTLATLAVQARKTGRPLLFDENGCLRGRAGLGGATDDEGMRALAFSGIHVLSPRIFEKITEEGVFSIISSYARLAREGEKIAGFRADEYYWRDLGRPENVEEAARDVADGRYLIAT
jgi:NDP-sugar pyrophosphorylase family protein